MSGAEPAERIKETIDAEVGASGRALQPLPPGAVDRPAIGLVVGSNAADAVAGAVLRANRAGHHVLVTPGQAPDLEAIEFARVLGATVVDAAGRSEDPVQRLYAEAKAYGFPGLVYHADLDRRMAIGESVDRLRSNESYSMRAAVESVVDVNAGTLVAIPAFDEAGTIESVVTEALEHADGVLVVDDGSEDETATLARAAGAAVVEHGTNRGYGAALKTAFREARRSGVDHLVVLDADAQHDPADVPRLVERQRETGAEVVIGNRFGRGAETRLPLYRRVGLSVVNAVTNLSLGIVRPSSRVRDTQSGFRVYGTEAVSSLADDGSIGDGMAASTDILQHAHQRGYDIEEVGATVDYAVENGSSQNPVSHGITLVMNLLRTIEQQRPVTMVGIPGLFSTMVGIAFGYWTIVLFLQYGNFPLGLAVTSSFFALAGIFACFTAIILHALNQHLDSIQ